MNVVSLMSCVGMLSRIITSGAIFQKSLQLDQKKMGKLTISKVLNLAAADAGSLDFVSTCAAFLSFSCLCVFILICPMLTSMCLNLQAEGDSLLCVRSIYVRIDTIFCTVHSLTYTYVHTYNFIFIVCSEREAAKGSPGTVVYMGERARVWLEWNWNWLMWN